MWDDEVEAAIDQVAREWTGPLDSGDLPAQVLRRLDHLEAHRKVSWAFAAPVAALVVAGGVVLGVFRSSGHQRAQTSGRQTPAPEAQVLPPVLLSGSIGEDGSSRSMRRLAGICPCTCRPTGG
jgi:hypothetical protein